jgi:hypothetical protein
MIKTIFEIIFYIFLLLSILAFYFYIGYDFLDWKDLPQDHWIQRLATVVKHYFAKITAPLKQKTRRLDVRLMLVIRNLADILTDTDYVLLFKRLCIYLMIVYYKTRIFLLDCKKTWIGVHGRKK